MMIFSPYGFESRWAHQLLPTNNVGVVANQRSQQSIGPHRPTQPFRKRFLPFSYRLLSHLFGILFQRGQFRFQLCPGTDFAQSILMSTMDKKTTLPQPASAEQHSEKLLLERLKNSITEEDYFRWLLFVVGFYRGVNKAEAAIALLDSFIEKSHNDEQKAHCQLALGQIATDEDRLEAALNHFRAA